MVRTINPTTGETIGEYSFKSGDWLEKQVEASARAHRSWSRLPLQTRLEAIHKFEKNLKIERENLARLMTIEMGKPLKQSLSEIDKCIHSCATLRENYPAWLALREYSAPTGHSVHITSLGPILGIMPWNFPLWQVVRFAVPALLAGNTILLKHAPNTWGSAEKISALFATTVIVFTAG